MTDISAIYGMQLEHEEAGYRLFWWQRDDVGPWAPRTLRLTEAEAEMARRCHDTLTLTPEFWALLARGAPPMGAWAP